MEQHTHAHWRPAWMTWTALVLILAPLAMYAVMLTNGYQRFDGRGILILGVVLLGIFMLNGRTRITEDTAEHTDGT